MKTFKYLHLIILLSGLIQFNSCQTQKKPSDDFVKNTLSQSTEMIKDAIRAGYEHKRIPRGMKDDGSIRFCGSNYDWTKGFFPGLCWNLYEWSGDEEFKDAALYFQSMFEDDKSLTTHHDLGFIFNSSYGKAYRITGDEAQKDVMIEAAESLITRFNPFVGCLKSWDTNRGWQSEKGWEFPVIIDNMINLELLFEVSKITGDLKYYNIAVSHANNTLKNHFRKDFSSWHVVDYNPKTGEIRSKETAQGYSNESAWARGQAWGLYGYVMAYRYTKDPAYLEVAENIATFILNHPNLPDDMIPYWDFNSPDIPDTYRDVSAAAIVASALIELDAYSKENFLEPAENILLSLSLNKYTTGHGENILILDHSVGSIPHGAEIDVPIVYADYYYIEALKRLE